MERRKKKTGLGMWIILGIMVVAMGGFGLSSVFSGSTSTSAMTVGDIDVSANDFNNAYQSRLAQLNGISQSDARMIGIPEMVIQSEFQVAALRDSVLQGGFEFSDHQIALEIAKIEAFHDVTGKFDPDRYQQVLSQNGLSESALMDSIRADLQRNLAVNIISQLVPEQPELLALANKVKGESRSADYLNVTFADTGVEFDAPDDASLQAYYEENQAAYMADPVRDLEIAYMIPAAVDDARIKAIYDEDPSAYVTAGTVKTAHLLPFDTEPEAKTITDKASFDAALADKGLAPADVRQDNVALDTLPSFGTNVDKDGIYGPVETPFGFAVYLLEGVAPTKSLTFEEAKADIANALAFDELQQKLADANDKTQDLIAGRARPSTIAEETAYELATVSSDETIAGVTNDPNFQVVLNGMEVGTTSAPIDLDNGGVAYVNIVSENEPLARPFADVKSQVLIDLTAKMQSDALTSFEESLMAQIGEGLTLEAVASENGLTLEKSAPVIFDQAQDAMPLPVAIELFNRENGEVWKIQLPEAVIIAQVATVVPFDETAANAQELIDLNDAGIKSVLGNSILSDYANAHGESVEATFNQTIINQITGASE